MITRVHHVGIVVRDLARAYAFWREALGLPLVREAEVADQGVRAALLAAGPCEVELLEPIAEDTGVARFLARRGGGLHHLCLEAEDVAGEVARLADRGVELIDQAPRRGLAGLIAFLHPRAAAGVLVELATPLDPHPLPAAPFAVAATTLAVADPAAASRRYVELFGLGDVTTAPGGEGPMLTIGGVRLVFAASAGNAPEGLAGLGLAATRGEPAGARLRRAGVPVEAQGSALVVDRAVASGVPLWITQTAEEEGRG